MTTDTETEPDYKVAARKLEALVESINLKTSVSPCVAEVEDKHIWLTWTVTINGKPFTYKMGIGHIDWKAYKNHPHKYALASAESRIAETYASLKYGQTLKDSAMTGDDFLKACEKIANAQKLQPKVYEVFGAVCRDDARHTTFTDWAAEFGYDSDSIKAQRVYEQCNEYARQANAFLTPKQMQEIAELAGQL